ncbi:MAG: hypothetical protein PHH37_04480 [Paludibacter sp.]|nr:hypothetical protein [Paludibacter sp.]
MKITKILTVMLLVVGISVQAQEENKTENYLPEAGNFAIGADASPVFSYIGNLLSAAGTNSLDLSSPVLYGKYYLDAKTAVRAILYINSATADNAYYAQDDAAVALDPLSNAQVTDVRNVKINEYFLSGGYQKFIGEKRLRGFYGGQLFANYSRTMTSYEYGNPMTEFNQAPSTYMGNLATRPLSVTTVPATFQIGVGGIAGFEYFIMPKLCIGGEISLNFVYQHSGQSYTKSEQYISGNDTNEVDVAVNPGSSAFSVQTLRFVPEGTVVPVPVQHAGIYVMFHF